MNIRSFRNPRDRKVAFFGGSAGESRESSGGEPARGWSVRAVWDRVLRAFRENTYRAVADLMFWGITALFALIVLGFGEYQGLTLSAGVVPFILAILALWTVYSLLPWEKPAGGWRYLGWRIAPLVAYPVTFLLVEAMVEEVVVIHYLLMLHAVYLFGVLGTLYYVAGILPLAFVGHLLKVDSELGPALYATFWSAMNLVFVGVVCVVGVAAGRQQKRSRALVAELECTQAELEAANAELARRAAGTRELAVSEERSRMAREIHDTLGHYLTAVHIQLDAADKAIKKDPARLGERLGEARKLTSTALSEVRRSVQALKPLAVQEKSGSGALHALAHSFEGTGRDVTFRVVGEERELCPETELALYRALQEGLTNALKHSGARRIRSRLTFEPEGVRLSVEDDGKGAPEGSEAGGFGLAALKERAATLGGSVWAGEGAGSVGSVEGFGSAERGFTLEVELPVPAMRNGTRNGHTRRALP